jgi:hypothetical protein
LRRIGDGHVRLSFGDGVAVCPRSRPSPPLTTRFKEVRQATGDDGRRQNVIRNVSGIVADLGGLSTTTISPTYGEEAGRLAAAEQAARSALGDDAFESAHTQGADRSLDHTARFAITTLNGLDPSTDR